MAAYSGLQIWRIKDVEIKLCKSLPAYFLKKSANVKGKQICKNGTTSRWKPNLYQVTLFHRDGFFKATPNPPFFAAPNKPQMKVKNQISTTKIPKQQQKNMTKVLFHNGEAWQAEKMRRHGRHGVFTVKVEFTCRKRS